MSTPSNVSAPADRSSSPSETTEQEAGLVQSHAWLTPVVVIVSIVVLFVAMFALTWGAGSGEVFGR